MRKITTPKRTYNVDFAWAPTFDGSCMIQYEDTRRLPDIAKEWDGLNTIHFLDEEAEQEYTWEGYTKLNSILKMPNGKVQLNLVKEA